MMDKTREYLERIYPDDDEIIILRFNRNRILDSQVVIGPLLRSLLQQLAVF